MLIFLYMFRRIHEWSHCVQAVSLLEAFWLLILSSLVVTGLFVLYISSWFSFSRWCISGNLSILSRLCNLLVQIDYSTLMILFISIRAIVMFLLSLLILLIYFRKIKNDISTFISDFTFSVYLNIYFSAFLGTNFWLDFLYYFS